jgi:hypothetical protein
MVSVKIKIEAYPTTDVYVRYHGLGIDQPLNEDFWVSQPHKIIATTYAPFTYEKTVDLPAGEHTAEYANSGYVPNYAWHAKIYVDDKLVGEGDAGRFKKDHLIVKFTVGAPPPPPPPPPPTPPAAIPWWLIAIIAGGVLGAVVGYAIYKRKV